MPDIHHDPEAQIERMRRREFTVFHVDYPFHGLPRNIADFIPLPVVQSAARTSSEVKKPLPGR